MTLSLLISTAPATLADANDYYWNPAIAATYGNGAWNADGSINGVGFANFIVDPNFDNIGGYDQNPLGNRNYSYVPEGQVVDLFFARLPPASYEVFDYYSPLNNLTDARVNALWITDDGLDGFTFRGNALHFHAEGTVTPRIIITNPLFTNTFETNFVLNSDLTIANNGGDLSLKGRIEGQGALHLASTAGGAILLQATAGNQYTGQTLITAGTTRAGAANVLSPVSTHTIRGTLDLNDFNQQIQFLGLFEEGVITNQGTNLATLSVGQAGQPGSQQVISSGGTIQDGENGGTVALNIRGGRVIFDGSERLTYSGDTTIADKAQFYAGNARVFSANSTHHLQGASIMDVSGTNQAIGGLTGTGAIVNTGSTEATLTVGENHQDTTYAGNFAQGFSNALPQMHLIKVGEGTLTLEGQNLHRGDTTVLGGTLRITGAEVKNNLRVENGTLETAALLAPSALTLENGTLSVATYASINAPITLGSGGGVLETREQGLNFLPWVHNYGFSLSGQISGEGQLAIKGGGALELRNTGNIFTGGTVIEGGALLLEADGALGAIPGIPTVNLSLIGADLYLQETLDLHPYRTLLLKSSGATSIYVQPDRVATINGAIQGTGGISKYGGGTLTLNGVGSYGGPVTVVEGTLVAGQAGSLGTSPEAIRLGDPATDRVKVKLAFNGAGIVVPQAVEVLPGNPNGSVGLGTWNGDATINGALNLQHDLNLFADGTSRLTLNGMITGMNLIAKTGTGEVVLGASNLFHGDFDISAGTVTLGHALALQNAAVSVGGTGSLNLNGHPQVILAKLSGTQPLNLGNTHLTVGGGNYSGAISGSGSIRKVGSGGMLIQGQNSYSGGMVIEQGIVEFASANSTGTGLISLYEQGILQVTFASQAFVDRIASGSNGFLGLTANSDHALNFTGKEGVRLGGGVSVFTNGISSPVTYSGELNPGSGDYRLGGPGKMTITSKLTGNRGVEVEFPETEFLSAKTIILRGKNDYTGNVRVANGTLIGDTDSLKNNIHLEQAGLVFGVDPVGLADGGTFEDGTYAGSITGVGHVSKNELFTLTLSNRNPFTGTFEMQLGTLVLAHPLALENATLSGFGWVDFSPVPLTNGIRQATVGNLNNELFIELGETQLTFGANNKDTQLIFPISGSGSLRKIGTGTTVIYGGLNHTGGTRVDEGTLRINSFAEVAGPISVGANGTLTGEFNTQGKLTNGGTFTPGNSPGLVTVGGDFVQTGTGTLLIEIAGYTSFDRVIINGNAFLGGTLQLSFIDGFTPQEGDTFNFLEVFGAVSGNFRNITGSDGDLRQYYVDRDNDRGIFMVRVGGLRSPSAVTPEPSSLSLGALLAACFAASGQHVLKSKKRRVV